MTFKINTFYYMANEYVKHATEEEEIEKQDLTKTFYAEIETMIKNGEIVIININGKMRLGKSTQAIAIGEWMWKMLQKYGMRKNNETFGLNNIARDQREYSRKMNNPKTEYTVIVIDESNELENTGENVTAERALLTDFSNIQAGRYAHTVYCSPKNITDPNADIILTVIGINKETQMTHNKLYYRFYTGGTEYIQLLGHINIPVGHIIHNWEKHVKKHFQKPDKQKNEQDKQQIQKWRKKDYYTEYMIRKYQKMELITKHAIYKPRLLDYADMILKTIEKTKKIAMNTNISLRDTVRNFIKIEARQQKLPMTIVGTTLATEETLGVLSLYKSLAATKLDIIRTVEQELKNKTTNLELTNEKLTDLRNTEKTYAEAIKIQLDEYRLCKKINDQYHETDEET